MKFTSFNMVQILLVAIANKPADVTRKQKAEKHQGKNQRKIKTIKKRTSLDLTITPLFPT